MVSVYSNQPEGQGAVGRQAVGARVAPPVEPPVEVFVGAEDPPVPTPPAPALPPAVPPTEVTAPPAPPLLVTLVPPLLVASRVRPPGSELLLPQLASREVPRMTTHPVLNTPLARMGLRS